MGEAELPQEGERTVLEPGGFPELDGDGQVVMARGDGLFPGSTLTIGSLKLTVTGVADSVTGTADAWVLPSEVADSWA